MNFNHELSRVVEENHLGHFVYLPKILGFDVHDIAGVTIVHCGLKTSMFNIVYGAPDDCELAINLIKQAYQGQPFAWWIPPSQKNAATTNTFIEKGLIIETIEHAMICDLSQVVNFQQKTDLVIKLVTNISMLQDFISVLEPYDLHVSAFYGRLRDELSHTQERLVVGYAHDKPVSVGTIFLAESRAGIFSLITRDDARGLGYGTDIMRFLMQVAKEHGCHSVTLSASSDSGYRIYERLGFVKVGEFECFEYPGEA